ncbi:MAG: UDP-N-acetylmuramoyl-L-alanyl-D-glutamate--2,6-diaminopimelate ligase [Clostridia bacterium]|nr:UDP-N-acetylmuramoyl-L-alanyl-D-glutamate--2,6-diaminopimelate ligase [Clostridia bacterium]
MKLSSLIEGLNVTRISGNTEIEISDICYDSRKATKGSVFVCIVGYETDGHKYIDKALMSGVAALIVQEGSELPRIPDGVTVVYSDNTRKMLAGMAASFFGHPEKNLKIIGVTGTNGKTTVTTLIKSILEFEEKSVALIGTNANIINGRVLPTERTTPESYELYELFAEMVKEGVEYVIMEVSSHSLYLDRVYGIEFLVGAFTNLTQDHLDFHKTMENYKEAKGMLFDVSESSCINVDDAAGMEYVQSCKCPVITYGVDNDAGMRASDIKISARGVIFNVSYEGKSYKVRLGIPGKFSVYNALTALSCVVTAGISIERAIEALTFAKGVMGRCETVYTKTDYTVIIDYAHTPDGLENIISTVREFCEGRVITLFGCGGDRDRTKRPIMGRVAATLSDFCVVTSDNPRTENPEAIIEDIMAGIKEADCGYAVIENRREAIKYALSMAERGDCIILAGKGHETYQIIGKEKNHFDEREVIEECLKELNS